MAIKVLNVDINTISRKNRQVIANELAIMYKLDPKRALHVYCDGEIRIEKDKLQYAIVCEKMNGSLRELLKTRRRFSETFAFIVAKGIINSYMCL